MTHRGISRRTFMAKGGLEMSGTQHDVVSSFLTLWNETNQKAWREVADLSFAAMAEGLRVAGELQSVLAQSAGRIQESAREVSGRIRDEVAGAISESQRLSSDRS